MPSAQFAENAGPGGIDIYVFDSWPPPPPCLPPPPMPEWRADSWVLALADDRLLKFFQGVVASAAGSQPGGDARADS